MSWKELHNKANRVLLEFPSWKFPGKAYSSITSFDVPIGSYKKANPTDFHTHEPSMKHLQYDANNCWWIILACDMYESGGFVS